VEAAHPCPGHGCHGCHGSHGEEKVLSKPCRNNRSLPANISRSQAWAWMCSAVGRAVSRLLRSISRSCRATSSAVLQGCLPLHRMCAQPWRAIDTLWGGAIKSPTLLLWAAVFSPLPCRAMTSTGMEFFWLACRRSRCFVLPSRALPHEGNKQQTSHCHSITGPKTLTVCFVLPIASLCSVTESPQSTVRRP
jgi:hypothetical protein